jgi:hypothetical protein
MEHGLDPQVLPTVLQTSLVVAEEVVVVQVPMPVLSKVVVVQVPVVFVRCINFWPQC